MTDLTRGPELQRILGFALPLTVANLLQQGYLLVDAIVVGHYVGVDGLAAVGAVGPVVYFLTTVFIGMSTAFGIRLAHLAGAGSERETGNVVLALGMFTVAWSGLSTALLKPFSRTVLGAMGIHGPVAAGGTAFLTTLAWGFLPMFGLGAVSAYLRGRGDSRHRCGF